MKHFTFAVNLLAVLSATLSFVSTASAEQTELRGAAQEPLNGVKRQQVSHSELKTLAPSDVSPSVQMPIPEAPREQLSAEERRQLRRDINDAGRAIYRQDRTGRPRRF